MAPTRGGGSDQSPEPHLSRTYTATDERDAIARREVDCRLRAIEANAAAALAARLPVDAALAANIELARRARCWLAA